VQHRAVLDKHQQQRQNPCERESAAHSHNEQADQAGGESNLTARGFSRLQRTISCRSASRPRQSEAPQR
jgi:hypothetical protein